MEARRCKRCTANVPVPRRRQEQIHDARMHSLPTRYVTVLSQSQFHGGPQDLFPVDSSRHRNACMRNFRGFGASDVWSRSCDLPHWQFEACSLKPLKLGVRSLESLKPFLCYSLPTCHVTELSQAQFHGGPQEIVPVESSRLRTAWKDQKLRVLSGGLFKKN